ncbi:ABC transporter ATP-binding protein [Pedobacter yulinensis]|uniref:ABC transporter ATP-binding protein n=1 Tax=Pedobacter yulinensis TaxID=2126353 RepID=A0A2T3HHK6_9SPHI|nr:ABC transporter ATP-binding protein [Pedobacter yulinensis]PST81861.1 ABC transporter ATP-binding protein [Pedobacter yulinensis]
MSNSIIRVKNLSKQYLEGQASGISTVSFELAAGEILAIIGESGSGKSTLLKCIYGLLKPDSGEIVFDNMRVKGPDEQLVPGHPQMKMVTQDFSLNIYAKVYDNIASQLSNTNVKLKESKTLAMMDQLRIGHLRNKRIVELSGGEQQRVAIARALVSDTRVLLLDEPFSQVDALLKNQLRTDIRKLVAETGLTVVLVSHDPSDGLFLADQLLILKSGLMQQTGPPKAVYMRPDTVYTARLLGNAVVLSRNEAERIGLKPQQEQVAFYPEWVTTGDSPGSIPFTVKDRYFKGFYEELVLERNGVQIRALQLQNGKQRDTDLIGVHIPRFLEF